MTASLLSVVAKERSASWLGKATNSFVRSKKVWIKAARVLRSAVISASERTVGEAESLGEEEALGEAEAEASEEEEVEGEGEAAEEDAEGKARDELWSSGTVSSRTKVSESVAKVTPVIDAADRIE